MPRYFFHIINGREVRDLAGTEFSGRLEARLHAITLASNVMSEIDANWKGDEWTMTVIDSENTVVLTLRFYSNFGSVH